jgi:hypothetical protein
MKQAITPSPAPHAPGQTPPPDAAPEAPPEKRFPGLRIALWAWLAGFGLLVAELILQALEALVLYFRSGGAGR